MANPYLWIVVVGGIIAFLVGAGVGMNDLANAFGTTYGAKILKLWQICILASICEFAGSVSLGGAVSSTISGGIADTKNFTSEPYLFMYGMLCASVAAFTWLALATIFVLPVSSTHSVVGGVIGFGLVHGGAKGVKWAPPKDDFPFVGGVVPVIASWFISPALTGLVSAAIYCTIKYLVMRPANSVNRATYCLPVIAAFTFFLEGFFILYKGAGKTLKWSIGKALWVGAIIGAGAGVLSIIFVPILRRRIRTLKAREAAAAEAAEREPHTEGARDGDDDLEEVVMDGEPQNDPVLKEGEKRSATGAVVREDEENDESSSSSRAKDKDEEEEEPDAEFRKNIERYDNYAEYVFRFLQIFTAICASFAHGASDVSNAVGPFAAIYHIYQNVNLDFDETPIWILCIGGAGLVCGLSTFGIRLMRLLGEKITLITPSRGFSAELAAALVVSFASAFGIPVSSTHCITGGVLAISIVDVGFLHIKWLMVLKLYVGWIGTLIITAAFSALLYAQGTYAPNE